MSNVNSSYNPPNYNGSLNIDMAKKFSEEESEVFTDVYDNLPTDLNHPINQARRAKYDSTDSVESYYQPSVDVKPEYRYIHGDPILDFSGESDEDFKNIDIDVSDELLDSLIKIAAMRLTNKLRPCSWDIWEKKFADIDDVEGLQRLIGECMVNDQLVDTIIAGIDSDPNIVFPIEPYYKSHKSD